MEPEKSGVKAYALLREALGNTHKVGLGSFVLRNKESLCIIKPLDNILILNKIRFAQEIRKVNDLNIPKHEALSKAELKMAVNLINQSSAKFNITKYRDSYSDELMKLIKAKASGKKFRAPTMRVVHNKTKDLMSQLKASLSAKKRKAS